MHIQEIILQARRLPELQHFYHERLGLALISTSHNAFSVQAGTTRLTFWQAPGVTFEGGYHFAFGVPQAAFLSALEWLRAHSLVLAGQDGREHFHNERWDADMSYFRDPAGNVAEFVAHSDRLPVAAGTGFSGKMVLQVTEIGLTTGDVRATARLLRERLKVGIFRDALDDNFAALGDQTARLILASPGRIWYPDSGVPAGIYPLSVRFVTLDSSEVRIDSPPDPPAVYPAESK